MKALSIFILILIVVLLVVLALNNSSPPQDQLSFNFLSMQITSNSFQSGEPIPAKFTCDGENINPHLQFSGIPEGTRTLAILVHDPDAVSGDFVHWVLWNIDPANTEIQEGSAPSGSVSGISGFGKTGYGGPCPPSGNHRYFFQVFALDTTLSLDSTASAAELAPELEAHTIDSAEIMGTYSRK